MSRGIVVTHKESGVRYAISKANFNPELHTEVRDLKPGETVLGYQPKPKGSLVAETTPHPTLYGENDADGILATTGETPAATPATTTTSKTNK